MNNNASEEWSVKVKKEGGIKRKNNTNKSCTGTVCMERNSKGIERKYFGNELHIGQSKAVSSSSTQSEDTDRICNVLHVDSNDLQVKWNLDTADNQAVSGYNFKSQESSEDDLPLVTESEEPEWVFKESFVDNKDLQVVSMGRFYHKKTKITEIQNYSGNKNKTAEEIPAHGDQCEQEVDEGTQNKKTRRKQNEAGSSIIALNQDNHDTTKQEDIEIKNSDNENTTAEIILVHDDQCEKEVDEELTSELCDLRECPVCKKMFRRNCFLIHHVQCNSEKEKTERSNRVLNKHNDVRTKEKQRRSTDDKPYKCKKYKKTLMVKDESKRHERIYSDVQPYSCKKCRKVFQYCCHLKKHERIHTGVKPYTCTYCNKGFSQKGHVKEHERIHTGVKPYTCTYCNKGFTRQSHLNEHERIHTGVKPYTCTYCSEAFTQQGSLTKHEVIHARVKPYSCSYCNKGFSQKGHVKEHERIHTGVKPYSCTYCNKGFTQQGHLKEHERIHTGVKAYTCTYCNKAFTKQLYLKRHERTHTIV